MTFSIDTASATLFSLKGLKISSETTESGGKLDTRLGQRIRKLQFSDQTLRDLELEATLKGVHSKSIETLTTLLGETCGFSAMTVDEDKAMRHALRTLLVSGFSFGISKLTGSSQTGGIDGSFQVEVGPAKSSNGISLADQVKSSGQVIVKGTLLPADQKQLALSTGYVTETADGLKAGYSYADGLLKVNDKSLDGGMVLSQLQLMDDLVNAFLGADGKSARAKPAEKEKPETVASGDAGAEAATQASATPPVAPATAPTSPVSAPAADCTDIQACVAQSIQAAMREDIDSVRRLAGQIDTLPKPDLGNKVQGRKLNGQALEALKADDYNGAVALLQSALRENPRDVEIAANLGFAMVKAGRSKDAVTVLGNALLLDPRRTSSWAPLAEALALSGRNKDAAAALWVAYQWSANREKSEVFYMERGEKEAATRPALAQMYRTVHAWVTEGRRPDF